MRKYRFGQLTHYVPRRTKRHGRSPGRRTSAGWANKITWAKQNDVARPKAWCRCLTCLLQVGRRPAQARRLHHNYHRLRPAWANVASRNRAGHGSRREPVDNEQHRHRKLQLQFHSQSHSHSRHSHRRHSHSPHSHCRHSHCHSYDHRSTKTLISGLSLETDCISHWNSRPDRPILRTPTDQRITIRLLPPRTNSFVALVTPFT